MRRNAVDEDALAVHSVRRFAPLSVSLNICDPLRPVGDAIQYGQAD